MPLSAEVDWRLGSNDLPQPCRFSLAGRERTVIDVLDHWPDTDHGYIKVRSDDGVYILHYGADAAEWSVVFYDSGVMDTKPPAGEPACV